MRTPTTISRLSATSIIDTDVRNMQGEDLGNIEDVMLDLDSGCVNYAVLSFGGILGLGDKLFAVPWQAFDVDPDNETFVLNVSKDRLESAPGFDKDDWPSFANDEWLIEVYEFYDVPYPNTTSITT